MQDMFDTMARRRRGRAGRQPGRRAVAAVRLRLPGRGGRRAPRLTCSTPGWRSARGRPPAPARTTSEGCLSVPGEQFPTGRPDWARVTGTDLDGNAVELEGTGLFARCLQHETDHLDGLLYLDRLVGTTKRAGQARGPRPRAGASAGS